MRRRSSSCAVMSRTREALSSSSCSLRRAVEPHVGDGGRRLPGDRAEEGELGHVVLPVAARPELEAAEALVTAHEVLGGHGIPDDLAGDGGHRGDLAVRRRAR